MNWSHELLSPAEQKLFRRLSVFVGGCTLEAVEAVCNAPNDLDIDPLDGVASLVDHSLLRQSEQPGEGARLYMLETVREYGLERLTASGEETATRRAHAAYALVLAEEGAATITPGGDQPAFLEVAFENDNIRAALEWLTATGNAEWGLRLGAALHIYWHRRTASAEGRDRLLSLLRMPAAAARTRLRANALSIVGGLAIDHSDFVGAREALEEALTISRELGDPAGEL